MIDHRSYTHNLSSYEIQPCDTGAVLYRLSYQAHPAGGHIL